MPLSFDAFKEGDEIPVLKKRPGVTQLVKYAALGELVSNWLDHGGRIRKIGCQYRGMDMPDKQMTLGGVVKRKWEEDGKKLAELELWVKNEAGKNTTPGSAIVELSS
jgi:hypothetical protein